MAELVGRPTEFELAEAYGYCDMGNRDALAAIPYLGEILTRFKSLHVKPHLRNSVQNPESPTDMPSLPNDSFLSVVSASSAASDEPLTAAEAAAGASPPVATRLATKLQRKLAGIDGSAIQLVEQLLQFHPNKRPKPAEVLQHPFIVKYHQIYQDQAGV
eukprot:NODE_6608_length_629_cov_25.362550_g6585_i0.p1 GENE.NODE_6608_length_629_cov_25.362550_g6585_i0~~NODE_6608_length_629_cov_25.362550_g6585_i0.p1  ORF type:complete len:186 (-),score=41.57 NODE_6608_length_629_cov_25.362550_g6585_i0:71-547(-)